MAMTLITNNTGTNQTASSFTSSIDSTYKLYIFKFIDINPATDSAKFQFQCNATDSTSYDETMTTTSFDVYHDEDDSTTNLVYVTGQDQAQGTSPQYLAQTIGNAADESLVGELHLFNPASTTYVKHFIAKVQFYHGVGNGTSVGSYTAGYINTTTAIDDIKFYMDSGNFDGTIKMYGVG